MTKGTEVVSADESAASAAALGGEGVSCRRCGYDLRASDAEGVCPECGLPVAASLGRGPLLRDADEGWVRGQQIGLRLATWGGVGVAGPLALTGLATVAGSFNPALPLLAVPGHLALLAGGWLLTRPEPGGDGGRGVVLTRLLLVVAAALPILMAVSEPVDPRLCAVWLASATFAGIGLTWGWSRLLRAAAPLAGRIEAGPTVRRENLTETSKSLRNAAGAVLLLGAYHLDRRFAFAPRVAPFVGELDGLIIVLISVTCLVGHAAMARAILLQRRLRRDVVAEVDARNEARP